MKSIPLKQFKKPDVDDTQLERCAQYLESVGYARAALDPDGDDPSQIVGPAGPWVYDGSQLSEVRVTGLMNLQNGMRQVAKCHADLAIVLTAGGGLGIKIV